jgi:hypothetical protein
VDVRRAFLPVLLLCTVAASPALADDKSACVAAYKQAQIQRKTGALLHARDQLLICSRDVCPVVVKSDCVPWLGEVTSAIASVVVDAVDQDGNKLDDVAVSSDGQVLATRLDGRAIDIDPGERVLRFESPGAPRVELRVVLLQGERDHRVRVTLAKPAMPPPAPPASSPATQQGSRPVPVSALAFGAVAVLGGAGFTVFGLLGNGERNNLDASGCKPNCSSSDVGTVQRDYIIADASLGVGVVSLALAAYFFVTRPEREVQAASFGVSPTPGGMIVSRSLTW